MQAIRINQRADNLSLQPNELATPKPGVGQVLVRIKAAGVNFADIMQYQNRYPRQLATPYIPGYEIAGDVVELGDNVVDLPLSTQVAAFTPNGGGYAEFAVVDAERCIPIPSGLDYTQVTALLTQGLTAWIMLEEFVRAGQNVLVTAASGGVGSIVAQLAWLLNQEAEGSSSVENVGATVYAATSDPNKAAHLDRDGMSTVNYSKSNWADQLRHNGVAVDVVLDSVGGDCLMQAWSLLRDFGTLVVYGTASNQDLLLSSEYIVSQFMHNPTVHFFAFTRYLERNPSLISRGLQKLFSLVLQGELSLPLTIYQGLGQAQKAWHDMSNRKTTGKVVISVC